MVLGIIADTTLTLSATQYQGLQRAFHGVDAILHAGPVGEVRVVEQLNRIAPTQTVCANAESLQVRSEFYVKLVWRLKKIKIGLIHGYGPPHSLMGWLLRQFEEDPVDVIVYGNGFEPKARQVGRTYFFNPGSFSGRSPEGSRGRRGPSRVGLLFIEGSKIEGQPGIVVNS